MKRPSFQFYPGDWLRDTALKTCSAGARGIWIDMICYMHEGTPYGYLKVSHKKINERMLARMTGESADDVTNWLCELEEAGVFSRDKEGCIFSKRMKKDEKTRQLRAAGGKKGGNPKLKPAANPQSKVNLTDNLETATEVNQKQTPSSSSSSSSSSSNQLKEKTSKKPTARGTRLQKDWIPENEDCGFLFDNRPDLDLNDTVASFIDYWTSTTGAKANKLDWSATWRNWVRNSRKDYNAKKTQTKAEKQLEHDKFMEGFNQ